VLLIAGSPVFDHDGYERSLRKMADECGLTDRVKFAGYRRDLPDVLAAMDIFAYTSIEKDTSPLALLSAMAAGLPIVAFDIEGVRELIDDEATLLTVPVANVDALSRTLGLLVSDVPLRQRLAEAARRVAVAKFGLQGYILEIESELVAACSRDIVIPDAERYREVNSQAPATNASTVSAVGS
jgi:glycosyltransferase involved in cell wall biosynthesis